MYVVVRYSAAENHEEYPISVKNTPIAAQRPTAPLNKTSWVRGFACKVEITKRGLPIAGERVSGRRAPENCYLPL